jgi:hypothetical protein
MTTTTIEMVPKSQLKAAYEQQARLADALGNLIQDVHRAMPGTEGTALVLRALEHLHPDFHVEPPSRTPVAIDDDHVDLIGLEA